MAGPLLGLLALVLLIQYQRGTLGQWLRSKLFNAGAPLPSPAPATGPGPRVVTPNAWMRPTAAPIGGASAKFGACRPIGGCSRRHEGVDFSAPAGDPIRAARAGRVTYAGSRGGYGLMVEVDHGDGWRSRYAHLRRMTVGVGDTVAAGDQVGESGATGNATGAHLHFEVRRHGVAVDPEEIFARTSGTIPGVPR